MKKVISFFIILITGLWLLLNTKIVSDGFEYWLEFT